MFLTEKSTIDYCEEHNLRIYDLVLKEEAEKSRRSKKEIFDEMKSFIDVMEDSAEETIQNPKVTYTGMIDGFAKRMDDYNKKMGEKSVTGPFIVRAMAMAFSTLESSAAMGKIVASPTAGAAGILPATILSMKEKFGHTKEELANGLLTAVGIGMYVGRYANFSGAEGGCQAETGSAAAMAAAAIVELRGGTVEQCFHAASIALVNILGLVCDPIAGLVEYPCTFRNANGVINGMISADMALAGVTSIVPFEEVVQAMNEVGNQLPASLRETGLGGLAGTKTGKEIRERFLNQEIEEE